MTWLVSKRADVSLTTTQIFGGTSAAGRMPGCLMLTLSICDSLNNVMLAGEGNTMYICSLVLLNNRKPQKS